MRRFLILAASSSMIAGCGFNGIASTTGVDLALDLDPPAAKVRAMASPVAVTAASTRPKDIEAMERLRRLPAGGRLVLVDGGASVLANEEVRRLIDERGWIVECGRNSGCDGAFSYPKPPKRPNPGNL